jgi:hypothetical protein
VRTAAGDTWHLTGLQRAGLLWLTAQATHGRHSVTVTELGQAIRCGRGTASLILRRLRSLELVGGRHPVRGRVGGFTFWLPTEWTALADRDRRAARWPSANDSTPTAYGGYLSRAGMRRAWRTRSGSPPVPLAPRRGAAAASPRARGRPWPPRYTDERCPRDGRRLRLVLGHWRGSKVGDLAATWAARCPRCHRAVAAALVLVPTGASQPERAAGVAARLSATARAAQPGGQGRPPAIPLPHRAAAAARFVPIVRPSIADELRLAYLGWQLPPAPTWETTPLEHRPGPPIPRAVSAPGDELDDLTARLFAAAAHELDVLEAGRQLLPPVVESAP